MEPWVVYVLVAAIALTVLGVFLREASRSFKRNRFKRQRRGCLEQLRKMEYWETEELLGVALHLKKSFPVPVIEICLGELAEKSAALTRQKLAQVYDYLGIVEQHVKTVREATSWPERAAAAEKLGRIGHPRAVHPLIATLEDTSEDREVRSVATRALGGIRDPRAIPALVDVLGRDVPAMSQPIADVLEGFGEEAVPALLSVLQSSKAEGQRYWAARILAKSRNPQTVVPLIATLKDHSERVRAEAARALGKMKARRAVHLLADTLLRDPVAAVQGEAAGALGEIGDERALEALKDALRDLPHEVRVGAMAAMEKMGDKAIPMFLEALEEANDRTRAQAAGALERCGYVSQTIERLVGESGETSAPSFELLLRIAKAGPVESIIQSLSHPDFRVRVRLCQLLAEARNPRALEPLIDLARKDPEWAVRARALEALIRLGDERSRPVWVRALREEEEAVRECMLESLHRLAPEVLQSMLSDLLPLLHDSNLKIRALMVRVIGSVRSDRVAPALIESLKDSSADVRAEAATLLGRYPQREAARALEHSLEDPEPSVRASAVRALGQIKDPASIPPLAKAFEGAEESYRDDIAQALAAMKEQDFFAMTDLLMGLSSPQARAGVVWAVGLKQDRKAIRLLETFLQDPEPIVRLSAARAIGQFASAEIGALLIPYLGDPDARVRASVVDGVAKSGDANVARKLVPLLGDPDPVVCQESALAIGRSGYGAAIDDIRRFQARGLDPPSQAAALIALGLLGDQTSVQKILQGVQDPGLAQPLRKHLRTCTKETQQRFFSLLALDSHLFWQGEAEEFREKAVGHYITLLRSSRESAARVQAMQALCFLRDSQCVPVLEASLAKDPNAEVRSQALVSLTNFLEASELLKKLVITLRDPASEVRLEAVKILNTLNPKDVEWEREQLVELLDTKNVDLQQAISGLLSRCYERDWWALADILMGTEKKDRILGLIRSLGLISDAQVGTILLAFVEHRDPDIRGLAAEQLRQVASHLPSESLLRYLEDPDEKVRTAMVRCLGKQISAGGVAPLMARLMDPSPRVRQEVAAAFGRAASLEDERPVEALRRMVQDASVVVRAQALISLLRLGVTGCSQIYEQTCTDLDEAALAELRNRLEKDGTLFQMLEVLKSDRSAQKRADALSLLAQVDLRRYAHEIVFGLQDPDSSVRIAAIAALAQYEDPNMQKAIEALGQDPVEAVRIAVRRRWLRAMPSADEA